MAAKKILFGHLRRDRMLEVLSQTGATKNAAVRVADFVRKKRLVLGERKSVSLGLCGAQWGIVVKHAADRRLQPLDRREAASGDSQTAPGSFGVWRANGASTSPREPINRWPCTRRKPLPAWPTAWPRRRRRGRMCGRSTGCFMLGRSGWNWTRKDACEFRPNWPNWPGWRKKWCCWEFRITWRFGLPSGGSRTWPRRQGHYDEIAEAAFR